jgi:CBS domain-containing protein
MTTKVREIMSAAPVAMAATESVSAAAKAMKRRGIGTVLVVADGRLTGLVTDRDIAIRVLAENRDPLTTRVGEICSSELAVLSPDDDVEYAARLVRERAVRRLPVIADGVPVGVVSIGDLAMHQDARTALSEISAVAPNR